VIGAGELESKGVTFFGDTLDTGLRSKSRICRSDSRPDASPVTPEQAPQAWTSSCAMGAFRRLVSAESPAAYVVFLRNGKVIRVRTYLYPDEALEAAGLSE
jgi:hypothetical protein